MKWKCNRCGHEQPRSPLGTPDMMRPCHQMVDSGERTQSECIVGIPGRGLFFFGGNKPVRKECGGRFEAV